MYIFLVGLPGVGKTRTIQKGAKFISELQELHVAPTSVTMASLVDCMMESKRIVPNLPDGPLEYNSIYCMPDELGAFMSKYDEDLIGGLTTFWDCVPYSQARRGRDIKIKIKAPQLNLILGCTPSNLLKVVPEFAWDQGFMSRVVMVYSHDKPLIDIFNNPTVAIPKEMLRDIKSISALIGGFGWDEDFSRAVNNWRQLGKPPVPQHPKLVHYNVRRETNLLKLAMVANVDRGDSMLLTAQDFNIAMGWLLEVEKSMPDIFRAAGGVGDSKAMDEIYYFVSQFSDAVSESKIVSYAKERVPLNSVRKVIEIMESAEMIKMVGIDRVTGYRQFKAIPKD